MTMAAKKMITVEQIRSAIRRPEIQTQTLFSYRAHGMDPTGKLIGEFMAHPVTPVMLTRAQYYGREQEVLACMGQAAVN